MPVYAQTLIRVVLITKSREVLMFEAKATAMVYNYDDAGHHADNTY